MSQTFALRSGARSAPEQLLGAEHPLARADERVRWLGRQAAMGAALLPAGGVVLLAGVPGLALVMPVAALVESLLLLALAVAVDSRRARVVEVIAQGCGALPIALVRRQRARLLRPRHISRLAAWVDALRHEARAAYHTCPRRPPLYVRAVVRQVDAELGRIAELLRGAHSDPATVARVELLLCGESSPLYGDDVRRLRDELHRIEFSSRVL